ncbi:NAD-binding protein [Candidatus Woesearchaeota archaeon]|nr:NAD-binding protein [Candidatus Woesearchaeota archaeon]
MPTSPLDHKNFARKIKIIVLFFVSLIILSTIFYTNIRNINTSEAIILILETLAYDPPEHINIQERILQVILMIFGTFIIWFSFWSIMDFIIEGHLYQNIMRWIKMKKISSLKDHYIIYGGGRVGEHVADLLYENKKKFIIIERDKKRVEELTKKGYLTIFNTIVGNDDTLLKAGIKRAKAIMSVLAKAEENILVILTAKELNPRIKVYSRTDKVNLVRKLKKAGADLVIVPEFAGADIIVSDVLKKKLKKHHFGE